MRQPTMIPFNGAFLTKDGELRNLDGTVGPNANGSNMTPFTGVFIGADGLEHDITELLDQLGGGGEGGVSLPSGGALNTVLAKASAANNSLKWMALDGSVLPTSSTDATTIASKLAALSDDKVDKVSTAGTAVYSHTGPLTRTIPVGTDLTNPDALPLTSAITAELNSKLDADTESLLPAGGITGYILTKQSAEDFDAVWAPAPAGGSSSGSTITFKVDSSTIVEGSVPSGFEFKVNDLTIYEAA